MANIDNFCKIAKKIVKKYIFAAKPFWLSSLKRDLPRAMVLALLASFALAAARRSFFSPAGIPRATAGTAPASGPAPRFAALAPAPR